MAVDILDEVGAAIRPVAEEKLLSLGFRADPLTAKCWLSGMKSKGKEKRGGIDWTYPFKYRTDSGSMTEFVDGYQTFEFGKDKAASRLKTGPVHLEFNTSISQLEIDQAQGDAQLINLKDLTSTKLVEGFQTKFAKKLWGTAASGFNTVTALLTDGLTFMDVATADVAGVGFHPTNAARSLWNPQVNAAIHALSYSAISGQMSVISEGFSQYRTEMIVSNETTLESYRQINTAKVIYVDEEMKNLGFDDQVSVNKVPWFSSIYCPGSGKGTEDNWIVFLRPSDFFWTTMTGRELQMKMYKLQPKQDTMVYQGMLSGNLICWDREHQGLLSAIDPEIV